MGPLILAALLVASSAVALPVERQVRAHSKLVRELREQRMPSDPREAMAIATVFDYAEDLAAAWAVRDHAHRAALSAIVGQPFQPATQTISEAAAAMTPDTAALDVLRRRALDSMEVRLLAAPDPTLEPEFTPWRFRQEDAGLWTRLDDGRDVSREIAVTLRNLAKAPVVQGRLRLRLEHDAESLSFECSHGDVAAGASVSALCWTSGTVPSLSAVREALSASSKDPNRLHQDGGKVTFVTDGLRFQVSRDQVFYENTSELKADAGAWAILDARGCGDKGTCTEVAKAAATGHPFVIGALGGAAAGALYIIALLAGGLDAAPRLKRAMYAAAALATLAAWAGAGMFEAHSGTLHPLLYVIGAVGIALFALPGFALGALPMVAFAHAVVPRRADKGPGSTPA